jgi:predicted HNH restriction endonuclease
VSRIRKKTFYLQFCKGTPQGHQKSIFKTPKVKKHKIQRYKDTYGIHPTKFASSTQKYKKVIETPNQPIEKKISNKSMFSTSKVKRRQKFVWGFPTEFADSIQNPKKIIETPNLPNRTKIFPKKSMVSTLKKKRSQKFV